MLVIQISLYTER